MRFAINLLLLFALAAPLQAQRGGPSITTDTDFGVLATAGRGVDFDGHPAGFAIGRGLRIGARIGDRQAGAQALTAVQPAADRQLGAGVRIHEEGAAWSASARGAGLAGTTADNPRTGQPGQGPHGIQVAYRVSPGTTGTVHVLFGGDASQGAFAGVSVDVDGDGQADYSARAGGQRDRARIPVTAGRRGLVLTILTAGQAAVRGQGRARYRVGLAVFFKEGGGPSGGCGFRSFGRDCGAHLEGQLVRTRRGAGVELEVSQAPAGGLGILIAGDLLGRPVPLPLSRCSLLVDPRGVLHAFLLDRAGEATIAFPLPRIQGVDINFQALALDFSSGRTAALVATNGQHLGCR